MSMYFVKPRNSMQVGLGGLLKQQGLCNSDTD